LKTNHANATGSCVLLMHDPSSLCQQTNMRFQNLRNFFVVLFWITMPLRKKEEVSFIPRKLEMK